MAIKKGGKFGKLTVVGVTASEGVRWARVKCTCGTRKDVRAHDLARGKHKSCGKGACKNYHRVKEDPTYWPAPPRVVTVRKLSCMWDEYVAKSGKGKSVLAIAEKHGVNSVTLAHLFRSIRRAGGIIKYKKKVERWLNATTAKNTCATTQARKPRKIAPRATKRVVKPRPTARSARATARKSTTSSR